MTEKTFQQIKDSIEKATLDAQRPPNSVRLLAVSKKKSYKDIEKLYAQGQREFGENYLQESLDKITYFNERQSGQDIIWHFIGPIQSNKTRAIAENFTWVHSIDRLKIAQRLNDQRPANLPPLQVCLQVNIDHEQSKSGVLPQDAHHLAQAIKQLPKLNLRGIMVIPQKTAETSDGFIKTYELFSQLKKYIKINSQSSSDNFDTLSMGMSGDFPEAIRYGATIIRLGTLLFGNRD